VTVLIFKKSAVMSKEQLCQHNPVVLDESPNTAAPSLVVCSLCAEVLESVVHERPANSHSERLLHVA
jgi:hypothetical protein